MAQIRAAEIIAVGSELLTPHRLDTNSLFLTGRLNEAGVVVRAKSVVGDDREALASVFRQSLERADLVLTTGGLGPTADDVTREVIAGVLGLPLDEDASILESIRARFAARGARMPEINRRQAQVPRGALLLPNKNGTAPGLLIEPGDKLVVLLPGPPRELRPMFETYVLPRVLERAQGRRLIRRVVKVTGRSESQVEEAAHPVYSRLGGPDVTVDTSILATPGQIEIHLAATGPDAAAIERVLEDGVRQLEAALGPAVFSTDGRTLEEVVGLLLQARGWRVAAAESCTAGGLLSRLTEVPGSSAWVLGGIVAYANDVKVEQLGVPPDVLAAHGAVSEPVAEAMAAGVRRLLHAEIGAAITGVAGPGGGSDAKPVGTVVVALAGSANGVRRFLFPGDREAIRRHATSAALEMIRQAILTEERRTSVSPEQ